jgi:hypothetical protein
MSLSQGQCTIFKTKLLSGLENFAVGTPYTYKIALYTGLATLNNATLIYTTTNEVVGSGYTAGGVVLVVSQVPVGDTVTNTSYVSFNPVNWTSANFSANGALIYNSTTGSAVAVLDFGGTKVPNAAGIFTITFPTATATTAILSIS